MKLLMMLEVDGMSEKRLTVKCVKGIGKAGFIGVRVYADNKELMEQLWGRIADYEYGGVKLNEETWLHRGKSKDDKAWAWIYASYDPWGDIIKDVTPEDVEEFMNLIERELMKVTTPWERTITLPRGGGE